MPTESEEILTRRLRPEHEWHLRIRQRNNDLRSALADWLNDGNTRRLRKAMRLVDCPPFAPPPSPRLRGETDRLVATLLRALIAPAAPKGLLREKRAYREALIGSTV